MKTTNDIHAFDEDTRVPTQRYIVQFWTAPRQEGWAWSLDSWNVDDAPSVRDVVDWAERHSEQREYVVFVRVPDQPDTPAIRLLGTSPNPFDTVGTIELVRID